MKYIEVVGNRELEGEITIGGAKNSSVAILPASILASTGINKISNIPNITDIDDLINILEFLECKVKKEGNTLYVDSSGLKNKLIPYEYTKKLRASYYFMGILLARFKKVEISLPGGCNLGKRPIDLHLKAFEKMGATISYDEDIIKIEAKELKGTNIYLDIASVGATINIMLAASLADGETVISNAAKEPEIINLATFINGMGGKIVGAGTSIIKIKGVKNLVSSFCEIIPDRIEAGTYLILGAATCKKLSVKNIIPKHLSSLISKLEEMGVKLEIFDDYINVYKTCNLKGIDVQTLVYPGFPTDLQQALTPLLTTAETESSIEETIWESRFAYIDELNKMGTNIKVVNHQCFIFPTKKLNAKTVKATDLRAGASLVIAALMAEGTSKIYNCEHILRGYENIDEKLIKIGAKIQIKED